MKQKKHAGSTQQFTQIRDIAEKVVIFEDGNACSIIEIQATNFALLSVAEQEAKIYAYASLLNSLSFPIQIIIRNKLIDISSYLEFLDQETKKAMATRMENSGFSPQQAATYIELYKGYVQELVKINSVLEKKFYIVINYSYLEGGLKQTAKAGKGKKAEQEFLNTATTALGTKTNGVLSQLSRLGLRAQVLEKETLIRLFYDLYNPTQAALHHATGEGSTVIMSSKNI